MAQRDANNHQLFPWKVALTLALIAFACALLLASGALSQERGSGWRGGGGQDYWQPGWMHRHMWGRRRGSGDMQSRMRRHWTYMHGNIPTIYYGARSTVKPDAKTIAAGGVLYRDNCASCHGKSGMGDGEAGKALSPSPALLAFMIQRPMAVDEYLMWSIAEGGTEFKTAMPAYKDTLARDDIWRIVAYMRAGFPPVESKAAPKAAPDRTAK